MDVKDFDYELPEELIAQDPLEDRSASRLMVMDIDTGAVSHRHFRDILEYLEAGDCLVINDTKVIPARLLGVKEDTGAHVEILLLRRMQDDVWECLVRPGKKLRAGARISFGEGLLRAEILEIGEEGNRLVKFHYDGIFEEVLDRLGEMPLPPYIRHKLKDKNRYQTVYAEHEGSAAAPTAGLHFTKELLAEIEAKGIHIAHVTLHVGLGTFRPVKVDKIEEHHMHSEFYIVPEETAQLVNETIASGHRIVSVGTTSTRTLESAAVRNPLYAELEQAWQAAGASEVKAKTLEVGPFGTEHEMPGTETGKAEAETKIKAEAKAEKKIRSEADTYSIEHDGISYRKEIIEGKERFAGSDGRIVPKYILKPVSGWTEIFIYPGYEWKLIDALITNFHLPQSTLVMLVSALSSREKVLAAYREAVAERYRFFSFGDACLFMRLKKQ